MVVSIIVMLQLACCRVNPRVSTHPGEARKVMEFNKGPGKSWKSHGIPPIGHGIFFDRRIIVLGV